MVSIMSALFIPSSILGERAIGWYHLGKPYRRQLTYETLSNLENFALEAASIATAPVRNSCGVHTLALSFFRTQPESDFPHGVGIYIALGDRRLNL